MQVQKWLVQTLSADGGVSNFLRREDGSSRIFPITAGAEQPEEYPLVTYQELYATRDEGFSGPHVLCYSHFQLNCLVDEYDSDKLYNLKEAIRKCLDGYSQADLGVPEVSLRDSGDLPLDPEARLVGYRLVFMVCHEEEQ